MKFPVNIEKVVLWGLLVFYIFIIVSYFWTRTREGLTTDSASTDSNTTSSSSSLGSSSTPTPTAAATSPSTEAKPSSSGTNQDKIDELNKKIGDLDKKKREYQSELNDLQKNVPASGAPSKPSESS
jgi:cell division protein FtsL